MRIIICTPSPAELVPIDFATLIFLLLVRHSINKFILCPYFVRRYSPYKQGESAIRTFHSADFIIQTYNNLRLPHCPSRLLVPRLLVY